ncbi:MAG TPA: hypothetical protein VKA47_02255 [Solirubrobacterales bacterium]|nr:hypothetical protein [Solirubrobacterales bacterium]
MSASARTRREVSMREVGALAAGAIVLSVVMTWPLVLHLGENVPKDLTDPLPQAWQIAWGGHALIHQPLSFFQSNQFWPLEDTLAFSDALLGYAPAGLIGSGPEAAVARYDVLFVLSYALCFVGVYLLARELGLGPVGATVAGAAFAFAPFRLEQDRHMQVISSGGIPLAIALALRGYRLDRARWVICGFAVAAWQFSIGPTLGLPFTYLLCLLGLIGAVVWLRRGRPALPRRLVLATVAGAALYVAVVAVIAQPYLRVSHDQPDAERPPSRIEPFSGPPSVLVLAPAENLIWGDATSGLFDSVENPGEKTLLPGLVILAIAITGLAYSGFDRRIRIGLGLGVVGFYVLALGFQQAGGLLWPYRIAYELLPGWDGMRTPGRLVTFASLGLALLAGAGATAIAVRARARLAAGATAAIAAALVLLVVVEGRGLPFDPTHARAEPRVPSPPADVSNVPAPQLYLPAETADQNRRYVLWSTDGFPELVNGRSSVEPAWTARLVRSTHRFPNRASVERLRHVGVRSVILDLGLVAGTPQEHAAARPIAGLGIDRERRGHAVVYDIDP